MTTPKPRGPLTIKEKKDIAHGPPVFSWAYTLTQLDTALRAALEKAATLEKDFSSWRNHCLNNHELRADQEAQLSDLCAENERLREALMKCAQPNSIHAPCPTCGPRTIEAGSYIAREALNPKEKA